MSMSENQQETLQDEIVPITLNLLFEKLNDEQVYVLFSSICDLCDMNQKNKQETVQLFTALYGMFSHLFITNEINNINIELFKEYSDIDKTIKIFKTRRDFPNLLRENIHTILHNIDQFQESAPKQCDSTISSYKMQVLSLIILLENNSMQQLLDLPEVDKIIKETIFSLNKNEDETLLINFLKKSLNKNHFKISSESELLEKLRSEKLTVETKEETEKYVPVEPLKNFNELIYKISNNEFIGIYQMLKSTIDNFSLKNYDHGNLLIDYLKTLKSQKDALNLNPQIVEIFKQEGYSLEIQNIKDLYEVYNNLYNQINYNYEFTLLLKQLITFLSEQAKTDLLKAELPIKIETIKEIEEEQTLKWYDQNSLMKSMGSSSGKKDSLLKKIAVNIPVKKPILRVENEAIFDVLENNAPNFKEVIDFYKGQFRHNYYSNKRHIAPILLLGEPGIGKTYFAKELAKGLKTGYNFIDMGSITASWILTGSSGSWQDAKQGRILEAMIDSPTVNPIVLLDEVDKVSGGKYDPLGPLHQLLEEVNAREITDEFAEITFDASGIIYIACANSINTLSEPLLSRFKVFDVPNPTSEQLDSIISNIYKIAIDNNPLIADNLSLDIINHLKGNSLREIKVMMQEAINNLMLSTSREVLNKLYKSKEKLTLNLIHFNDKKTKNKMGF